MKNKQKAAVIYDLTSPITIDYVDIPELGPNEVLVQNRAIGLNPIDWKSKKYDFAIHKFPWINGRESSGEVIKVGAKVPKQVTVGTKVIITSTSYRDLRTSTFQNLTVCDYRLVWKLPEFLTFEQGATLGVGLTTAAMILYDSFEIPYEFKFQGNEAIIIWGASSVVGQYLIQLAKTHNLRVIAISSFVHQECLISRGADILLDRYENLESMKNQVVSENIKYGVDCVSEKTSRILLEVLKQHQDSMFSGIVSSPKSNCSIKMAPVSIKKFHEDLVFGQTLIQRISKYIDSKRIYPVSIRNYRGLESIETALSDLENGSGGKKFVISLE